MDAQMRRETTVRARATSRGRRFVEHADLYVTSTVACVLLVLNVISVVPASYVDAVTLAVLALMSINMLLTRMKIDEIADSRREHDAPVTLDPFPPSYDEHWRHAGDILLYGTSLLDTFLYYQQWIAERLTAGHRVRVLLMKPESQAVKLAAERAYMRTNHHDDAALRNVLSLLTRLATETGQHVEIRLTNQEPAFTAIHFSPAGSDEVIYLMYYRYRMNSDDQLRMVLRPRDERWFNLHRDQLEHLWRDATPYAAGSLDNQSIALNAPPAGAG
jgi:hypothetical protein